MPFAFAGLQDRQEPLGEDFAQLNDSGMSRVPHLDISSLQGHNNIDNIPRLDVRSLEDFSNINRGHQPDVGLPHNKVSLVPHLNIQPLQDQTLLPRVHNTDAQPERQPHLSRFSPFSSSLFSGNTADSGVANNLSGSRSSLSDEHFDPSNNRFNQVVANNVPHRHNTLVSSSGYHTDSDIHSDGNFQHLDLDSFGRNEVQQNIENVESITDRIPSSDVDRYLEQINPPEQKSEDAYVKSSREDGSASGYNNGLSKSGRQRGISGHLPSADPVVGVRLEPQGMPSRCTYSELSYDTENEDKHNTEPKQILTIQGRCVCSQVEL